MTDRLFNTATVTAIALQATAVAVFFLVLNANGMA